MNRAAHHAHHGVPLQLVVELLIGQILRAEIRGQDQDHVAEVDRTTLAVGQPTVVEHLQQDVEDLAVGLLDLVEQDHRVRAPADRFGELAALVVADVPGRCPDQPRDRVLLGVLAHVDPDHRPLVVEQELGQRLGQLGLADTGRAEEQERSGRPVGVGDAGPGPPDGVGHRADGRLLTDQPVTQPGLHGQQLLGLALQQPAGRDAGPVGHHLGDVGRSDLLGDHRRGQPIGLVGLGHLLPAAPGSRRRATRWPWPGRPRAAPARPRSGPRRSASSAHRPGSARTSRPPSGPRARAAPPRRWPGPRSAGATGRRCRRRIPSPGRTSASASARPSGAAGRSPPGEESISIRSRDAASSTRSIALSGS